MSELIDQLKRLTAWYKDDVIPLWKNASYDSKYGGFFEAIDYSGKPIPNLSRRVRVQSRQVHTWTCIAERGWEQEGEKLARDGFLDLINNACPGDAYRGCIHTLTDKNHSQDQKRDLYDQAFLLLACSARIRAGDQNAQRIAERTIAFLDREFQSPAGGWIEDDQNSQPRRANPHMHLLEAFMALHEATKNNQWLNYATSIVDLFNHAFFDPHTGTLREFFTAEWKIDPGPKGEIVEPGHMMEWAWLLQRYATISQTPLENAASIMAIRATELSKQTDSPFLLNTLSLKNPNNIGARRLWPQTEYLRTLCWLLQNNLSHSTETVNLINALFETYFNQNIKGVWCDEFDTDGHPIADNVPASILYHLYETVSAAEAFIKRHS